MAEPDATNHTLDALSRDRLLSGLLVVGGLGLFLALPFALQAGSAFFLPLASAVVLSLALAPLADWLGARGIPNTVASILALATITLVVVLAIALVIQPAFSLVDSLPAFAQKVSRRIDAIAGTFGKVAKAADSFNRTMGSGSGREVVVRSGSSVQDVLMQTPGIILEVLLTILLALFMLEARIRLRRQLLLERTEFTASLKAARVLRDVQAQMGAYFATTFLVACGVGIIVGLGAAAFGWEGPVMWGGLAALLNLLPYIGPLSMVSVLALFGLSGDEPIGISLMPAVAYITLHAVESNAVTPYLMGRRLQLSPVAILASLIYFSWVWGVIGLFLAGPILLVIAAMLDHIGRPNLVGFLFGEPLFEPPVVSIVEAAEDASADQAG